MKDIVSMTWANCNTWGNCPLCGGWFKSYSGPVVELRQDGEAFPLCDECAGQYDQGTALMAVRDRFNESLTADTRPLDNIGRPLDGGFCPFGDAES